MSQGEELETLAPVRVHSFKPDIAPDWDRFVLAQPHGTLFHLTAWKQAIEATFSYDPCYVYAERGGQITGVAPVFLISNWIEGRCLLSTPFAVYGGICAADAESENALIAHLKDLAQSRKVEHLELRYRTHEDIAGFSRNSLYVTFTTTIARDPDANLKRLPRDTRYMIRKAAKAGLCVERGIEKIDDFYRLFAHSMKRLGTPVLPHSFFLNLLSEFKGSADLLLVYSGSKPVAGVFYFVHRDTILPYYAGCSDEATRLAANNFMYWELLKYAAEIGMREFDFGRSKRGTGSFDFKTQWNMSVQPLDYQVLLVQRKEMPNFSPVNPKFELAARVWRQLPSPLATWLGPHVVRWFP
jgi:FemAB-related protein (PEP-CTERM system-associated)